MFLQGAMHGNRGEEAAGFIGAILFGAGLLSLTILTALDRSLAGETIAPRARLGNIEIHRRRSLPLTHGMDNGLRHAEDNFLARR